MAEQSSSAAYDQGYALAAKRLTEAVEERYADLLAAAELALTELEGVERMAAQELGGPTGIERLVLAPIRAAIKKAKGQ